jgi:hypothetical protein
MKYVLSWTDAPICLKGQRKTAKNLRIAGVPAEGGTEYEFGALALHVPETLCMSVIHQAMDSVQHNHRK